MIKSNILIVFAACSASLALCSEVDASKYVSMGIYKAVKTLTKPAVVNQKLMFDVMKKFKEEKAVDYSNFWKSEQADLWNKFFYWLADNPDLHTLLTADASHALAKTLSLAPSAVYPMGEKLRDALIKWIDSKKSYHDMQKIIQSICSEAPADVQAKCSKAKEVGDKVIVPPEQSTTQKSRNLNQKMLKYART